MTNPSIRGFRRIYSRRYNCHSPLRCVSLSFGVSDKRVVEKFVIEIILLVEIVFGSVVGFIHLQKMILKLIKSLDLLLLHETTL